MRGNPAIEQLVNHSEQLKQNQPDTAQSEGQDVAQDDARPDP